MSRSRSSPPRSRRSWRSISASSIRMPSSKRSSASTLLKYTGEVGVLRRLLLRHHNGALGLVRRELRRWRKNIRHKVYESLLCGRRFRQGADCRTARPVQLLPVHPQRSRQRLHAQMPPARAACRALPYGVGSSSGLEGAENGSGACGGSCVAASVMLSFSGSSTPRGPPVRPRAPRAHQRVVGSIAKEAPQRHKRHGQTPTRRGAVPPSGQASLAVHSLHSDMKLYPTVKSSALPRR